MPFLKGAMAHASQQNFFPFFSSHFFSFRVHTPKSKQPAPPSLSTMSSTFMAGLMRPSFSHHVHSKATRCPFMRLVARFSSTQANNDNNRGIMNDTTDVDRKTQDTTATSTTTTAKKVPFLKKLFPTGKITEPNLKAMGKESILLLGSNFSLKAFFFVSIYSSLHFGVNLHAGLEAIGLSWVLEKVPENLQDLGLSLLLVELLRPVRYSIMAVLYPMIRMKAIEKNWFNINEEIEEEKKRQEEEQEGKKK